MSPGPSDDEPGTAGTQIRHRLGDAATLRLAPIKRFQSTLTS
jgi:hypothetical protein